MRASDRTDRPSEDSAQAVRGGRARVVRRAGAAVALVAVAGFVSAQPVDATTLGTTSGEQPAARAAVLELTGARAAAPLPAGFAAEHGYRPVVVNGLLVDPDGACSSPVSLPAEFVPACQAHDLGYDLLRYADDRGRPLGPWARQAIDAALDRRMHAACHHRHGVARARCHVMATVADAAVDLNSRRQNYAAPRPEYLLGIRLSGKRFGYQLLAVAAPAALVLSALGLLIAEFQHRKRPRVTPPADRRETTR